MIPFFLLDEADKALLANSGVVLVELLEDAVDIYCLRLGLGVLLELDLDMPVELSRRVSVLSI